MRSNKTYSKQQFLLIIEKSISSNDHYFINIIRGVFTKKICDTGLGGVGGQKGIKTHNCKKSLLSFNY